MLCTDFLKRATKRQFSTEPFVDYHAQSILIAGWQWAALNLFGCHIARGSSNLIGTRLTRRLSNKRNAKVTQQHLVTSPHQHIFRLDIAVDNLCLMSIVESVSYLPHVRENGR